MATPKVQYLYADGPCARRPRGLVYPNGRTLRFDGKPGLDQRLGSLRDAIRICSERH